MDLEELQKYKTEHVQTSKLINNLDENIGNFIIFVLRYLDERYGDGKCLILYVNFLFEYPN